MAVSVDIPPTPFAGFDHVNNSNQVFEQLTRIFSTLVSNRVDSLPNSNAPDKELLAEYEARAKRIMAAHHLPESAQGEDIKNMIQRCLAMSDVRRIAARLIEMGPISSMPDLLQPEERMRIYEFIQSAGKALRYASTLTTDHVLGPIVASCIKHQKMALLATTECQELEPFSSGYVSPVSEIIDIAVRRTMRLKIASSLQRKEISFTALQRMTARKLFFCAETLQKLGEKRLHDVHTLVTTLLTELPGFAAANPTYARQLDCLQITANDLHDFVVDLLAHAQKLEDI